MQIERRRCKRQKIISKGKMIRVNRLEEEFGCTIDSGEGVWRLLSEEVGEYLDDTVASLASFHVGDDTESELFFACTAIIIESNKDTTSFLTSLSLVRSIDGDSKIRHDLRIKVRFPNNSLCMGWLDYYDLNNNVAVVSAPTFYDFRAAHLDHQRQFEFDSQVVAVGRCFNSGTLMATDGLLTDNRRITYRRHLAVSTCKTTMTGVGGPLVDFRGDFVGMNFYYDREETPFLPKDKILQLLMQFSTTPTRCWETSKESDTSESDESDFEGSSVREMTNKKRGPSVCTICNPECDSGLEARLVKRLPEIYPWPYDWGFESVESRRRMFESRGYPLPVLEDGGMHLRYTFEEEFCEDIWNKLTKRVASNLSRSVVALASLSGGARHFACTGVFIDCDRSTTRVLTSGSLVRSSVDESKVADDLKIEVILPDKRHVPGMLQHYSLHYNVAVVVITEKFRCTRTANIDKNVKTGTSEVLAIGRVYESGKLMAASGTLTGSRSELKCEELRTSTCEITKAGIGGPLVDLNGDFVGMNFYGLVKTPYMPKDIILELLENFDSEGTVAADLTDVPGPYELKRTVAADLTDVPDPKELKRTVAADLTDVPDPNELKRWPVPKPYWCYPSWHALKRQKEVYLSDLFDDDIQDE